jgi:GxxExxY protein
MGPAKPEPIPEETEEVGRRIIGCAITVHRILGPGFKEPIYQRAFCLELDSVGLSYECEKRVSVRYKHWEIPGHRIDLLVGGCVIVELKVAWRLKDIHKRQVVSYLRATNLRLGFVINFNVDILKDGGIKRVAL